MSSRDPVDQDAATHVMPDAEQAATVPDVGRPSPAEPSFDDASGARYEEAALLGAGGMGEVRLCRDARIGREVAMKVMLGRHSSDAELRSRFLREACVQGQLEHPSIVPVYDLGTRADGTTFFTMKRVRGRTLRDIVEALHQGDPETRERYSRRKLVTAFATVCHAVELAHSRGIIHRDIKPANVMLGDFGEVYLLDWGLAKVVGGEDDTTSVEPRLDAASGGATLEGAILGTPGYMAPEQFRGVIDGLDARTDVYALGAILFEILTLERLHAPTTAVAIQVSTLEGVDARASLRAPDREVPPELEGICVRATALDPTDRYASAGEMVAAIERFLDGDRDLELRRALARQHAQIAEQAAERALASGAPTAIDDRSRALGEVGRALALDPGNAAAMRTMLLLMTEPPRDVPASVEAELEGQARRSVRYASTAGVIIFPIWLALFALVLWMGVRSWPLAGLMLAGPTLATVLALVNARARRPSRTTLAVAIVLRSLGLAAICAIVGPLLVAPGAVAAYAMAVAVHADRGIRRLTIALGFAAIAVPVALEWVGAIGRSYEFDGTAMSVLPRAFELPEVPTFAFLLVLGTAVITVPPIIAGRMRDALSAADRDLHLRAWQLRQIVPDEPRG